VYENTVEYFRRVDRRSKKKEVRFEPGEGARTVITEEVSADPAAGIEDVGRTLEDIRREAMAAIHVEEELDRETREATGLNQHLRSLYVKGAASFDLKAYETGLFNKYVKGHPGVTRESAEFQNLLKTNML